MKPLYWFFLPKPKSDITLRFFKNRIANSRINLLSRYHFTILRLKFTKPRSNLLSRDRNFLSRDQIYYLEIKFTKSRSNLLRRDRNLISQDSRISYDRIFHVVIKLYFPIMHPSQDSKFDLGLLNLISTQ